MAFKKRKRDSIDSTSPQSLFMDIKNKSVDGLLSHQDKMISEYIERFYNVRDVALELPTGSGKTLVGLLIGEYRRRKENKKVVYICPTIQLVNQVVEQSKEKYGIKTTSFTGKIKEYNPSDKSTYIANESIAVTTYSGFFNNNTFFCDADILIFDDAHSADSYISHFWSVEIDRKEYKNLFLDIANILKNSISAVHYERMVNGVSNNADREWVDKIPMHEFNNVSKRLLDRLDEEELDYTNKVGRDNIKDYFYACNMFISASKITIRPLIAPTETFKPFNNAFQRIYMSATLGESGELERITGVENINRIGIPDGWDKQGFGRRLFMFPEAKFNKEDTKKFILKLMESEKRSVYLVPRETDADDCENLIEKDTKLKVYRNKDISKSKRKFVGDYNCVAVLSNRFDGIDFEKDECRLLFIDGIPTAMNLQERFLSNRLATSILFNERVRTRLTQAIGRCTRGLVDYSTVCIIGSDLEKELVTLKKRQYFHPELQAEIKFGYDMSRDFTDIDDAIENHIIFMEQGDIWGEQEDEILAIRSECYKYENTSFKKLKQAAKYEVRYQYSIWNKDYGKALISINKILEILDDDILKGYRGYWSYIASSIYNLNGDYNKSKELIYKALACTKGIPWLSELLNDIESKEDEDIKNEQYLSEQVECIEKRLVKFLPGNKRYTNYIKIMMEQIRGIGTNIEKGIEMLGDLLGFISENDTRAAAPDTYWILPNGVCIISECKIKEYCDTEITVKDIREARTHRDWLVSNKIIKEDTITYTVVVSNSKYIHKDAIPICNGIYYIDKAELIRLANNANEVIGSLFTEISEEGNAVWRNKAMDSLQANKFLTSERIIEVIKDSPISKVKVKK